MPSGERASSATFSFDSKLDEIVSAIKSDREEVAHLKQLIDANCQCFHKLQSEVIGLIFLALQTAKS
jgi:hypothetical protein